MGYIKLFYIMLITLLSMQFATSSGSLFCFTSTYLTCYLPFVQTALQDQCNADQAVQCLEQIVKGCDISDSTALEKIQGMEQLLKDLCQTGSEMNKGFLKYKHCIFEGKVAQLNPGCYDNLTKDISKYKVTGNTEKDQKALLKIACGYTDEVKKCVSGNVKDVCGADAQDFQRKLSDPANNLEKLACNSSPAIFGRFWTLLLQATAILISLQYFRLSK